MTRHHVTFDCEGSRLVGTLDEGLDSSGLLVVSGGNEIRSGAFAGQAQLATHITKSGHPVFRYDRRGIGDSEGGNGEFASSGPDIAAALRAFRDACPHVKRVIGFGNCDAASALMLEQGAGLDGLVLSNPWIFGSNAVNVAPSPGSVRNHYRRRLTDPSSIKRLLTGQVSFGDLVGSLRDALRPTPPPSALLQEMAAGIEAFQGPVRFLIADRDRTGQAFVSAWRKNEPRIRTCPGASHAYVEVPARDWLIAQLLEALRA